MGLKKKIETNLKLTRWSDRISLRNREIYVFRFHCGFNAVHFLSILHLFHFWAAKPKLFKWIGTKSSISLKYKFASGKLLGNMNGCSCWETFCLWYHEHWTLYAQYIVNMMWLEKKKKEEKYRKWMESQLLRYKSLPSPKQNRKIPNNEKHQLTEWAKGKKTHTQPKRSKHYNEGFGHSAVSFIFQ